MAHARAVILDLNFLDFRRTHPSFKFEFEKKTSHYYTPRSWLKFHAGLSLQPSCVVIAGTAESEVRSVKDPGRSRVCRKMQNLDRSDCSSDEDEVIVIDSSDKESSEPLGGYSSEPTGGCLAVEAEVAQVAPEVAQVAPEVAQVAPETPHTLPDGRQAEGEYQGFLCFRGGRIEARLLHKLTTPLSCW